MINVFSETKKYLINITSYWVTYEGELGVSPKDKIMICFNKIVGGTSKKLNTKICFKSDPIFH